MSIFRAIVICALCSAIILASNINKRQRVDYSPLIGSWLPPSFISPSTSNDSVSDSLYCDQQYLCTPPSSFVAPTNKDSMYVYFWSLPYPLIVLFTFSSLLSPHEWQSGLVSFLPASSYCIWKGQTDLGGERSVAETLQQRVCLRCSSGQGHQENPVQRRLIHAADLRRHVDNAQGRLPARLHRPRQPTSGTASSQPSYSPSISPFKFAISCLPSMTACPCTAVLLPVPPPVLREEVRHAFVDPLRSSLRWAHRIGIGRSGFQLVRFWIPAHFIIVAVCE